MNTPILPESICKQIDDWTTKYPADKRQSAVLPVLSLVQEYNGGWLSKELMNAVADYLEMPRIAVYEVATFYSMYELQPNGQHKICVCTNVSCMLMGCGEIVKHLKDRLQINFGETTPDGKYALREVECLGACISAPCMYIGKQYHEHLTPEKVDKILGELK